MNDNNKKKRNRNPEARQKAFEAKFLNQVFGDLRCTAVSIEQTEYAGKTPGPGPLNIDLRTFSGK